MICSISVSMAQQLKGKVTSRTGEPLPYATIYIYENTYGIVTDAQGVFQVTLKPGQYTLDVRFLGYESQTKKVIVGSDGLNLEFTLVEKTLNLNEVTVRPTKGNPANNIMRHVIARAPYHLYQVQSYKSDNYLKGSVKIESIPGLMKAMIKDKKIKSLIGQTLVLESQNKISFRSPSRYTQQVIAFKSSVPKEMEPKGGGIRVVISNIYAERYDDFISPLASNAFQYYNYKLIDVSDNGSLTINKIQVTPKIKNAVLYSGYLYVVDKDWSIFSIDLSVTEMGTTSHYKVNYQEIHPSVFLPITYNMIANINTMGIKGSARFYSSVKYSDIQLNSSAVKVIANDKNRMVEALESPKQLSPKEKKTQATIENLLSKEKLSSGDAIKLARLSAKTLKPKEIQAKEKNNEIVDSSLVKFEVDSMASMRDSAYWETVRNVPLSAEEGLSFQRIDSMPSSKSIKTTDNSLEFTIGGNDSTKKRQWLTGGSIPISKSVTFGYNGILRGVLKEYNFVDGWWLGQTFSLDVSLPKAKHLRVTPQVYYVTGRKTINWRTNVQYSYLPLSNGQFSFGFGNSTSDIQGEMGTPRILNTLSSLIAGDNVIRFYQNKDIKMANRIDLANGLFLRAEAGYESRSLVNNSTNFHITGMNPRPNVPNATYSDAFPNHTATTIDAELEYTPQLRYKLRGERKNYISSDYPTFTLNFKTAFPLGSSAEQSSYSLMNAAISQEVKLGEWTKLYYRLNAGTYLSKNKLYAPDFHYFQTQPLPVSLTQPDFSFALLPNYTSSVSQWAEFHGALTSDYLLLKRIGFLQKLNFNETLQLNMLYEKDRGELYSEVGYAIGFQNILRVGVFTSFTGNRYEQTGIRISLSIFGGNKW